MKKLMLSVLALAAITFSINAANNTASGTAAAALIANLAVSSTNGSDGFTGGQQVSDGKLEFGTIGIGTTGTSTVTIAPASTTARSVVGDANLSSTGNAPTAAAYKVTGANQAYTVAFGASSIVLTGITPTNHLTVNNFKTNLGVSNVGTITGGASYFAVGADLLIPSTALVDVYSGTFAVTVTYN